MIHLDKVKIIKKIGYGMYGTTYLANYNGKLYAVKIQHILEKDKKKDYKNEIWREFDLYKYIDTLNKEDQVFFTKLYDYKIYDNCTHIQDSL
jgi:serine/threonine protein kinase